ncbi:MAG: 1-acyl-sn-glycerol-3-phosphate acyltransferase [Rhodospirillales bacterium]|jgi:1-acyl-sn-glycerol-3-phosphate acyltransferase|nr:1-acyl-sn-glycerol-3-phosphate acyltransferase [Rhodospirillales bacterium]
MNKIRSTIFDILQLLATALSVLVFMLVMPLPWWIMQSVVNGWARIVRFLARYIMGIHVRVIGMENIPKGPIVIASKHQSAWDTSFFQTVFPRSVYIMKKELLSIPVWGWVARKVRSVAVDRAGGASALKALISDTLARLEEGRAVVIFPEGTRMLPGAQIDFHPGVAAIYKSAGVPVVPVALNSGLFWGRSNVGEKTPGTITVEFLPAIAPGGDRKAFMKDLQTSINEATARLEAEASAEFSAVADVLAKP